MTEIVIIYLCLFCLFLAYTIIKKWVLFVKEKIKKTPIEYVADENKVKEAIEKIQNNT